MQEFFYNLCQKINRSYLFVYRPCLKTRLILNFDNGNSDIEFAISKFWSTQSDRIQQLSFQYHFNKTYKLIMVKTGMTTAKGKILEHQGFC